MCDEKCDDICDKNKVFPLKTNTSALLLINFGKLLSDVVADGCLMMSFP
jgi:hypothetical protein